MKEEVTRLALAHSLTTRYTSLVAADSEVVTKEPARRVEQPSARAEIGDALSAGAPIEGFAVSELEETMESARRTKRSRVTAAAAPPPPPAMAAPAPLSVSATGHAAARVRGGVKGGVIAAMKRALGRAGGGDREEERAFEARSAASPIEAAGSDRYSEEELAWLRERASGELDLVFLVDETGSMGPYIEEVKARLLELVGALRAMPLCRSLRLGVVTYRDHPPQDGSYASRVVPLTDDVEAIEREARELTASGGGDGPESVTDGLFDVVRLAWRPGAAKAVVWFGDAPPHGVEPHGDGFPQGCPCGNHWYAQAESCREMGVAIYAVGCLPGLRGYAGAEEVFRTVAKTTRGIYLPLTAAGLLVPLMASAAATELDRRRVDAHVLELVRRHEQLLRELDERERVRWLGELLAHEGVRPREMVYAEGAASAPPLRFRELSRRDVEAALDRLRSAGTLSL